jgi:hypothetical protein
MAQTVSVIVGSEDRARLAAILGDRNRPLKHMQRANIVLLSAERLPILEVARRAGVIERALIGLPIRLPKRGLTGPCRQSGGSR